MVTTPRSPAVFVGRRRELDTFVTHSDVLRLFAIYGVAGVGKTSFSLRAAEALLARAGGRLVYHACRTGDSVTTVIGSALDQLGISTGAQGDRLEMLLHFSTAEPIALVIDDAHLSKDPFLFDAITHLASRQQPLWLCVSSREVLPISPAKVDHLVINLKGLSSEDSSELLRCLESLYGPPPNPTGIESGIDACGGNPLRLKQLFSSLPSLSLTDELGLGELGPVEAEILATACAFRRPAPPAAFERLLDPAAFRSGLQYLTRRFLVELAQGLLSVHDMVRDEVARSKVAPTVRHHLHCIEYYQQAPPSEERQMELLFHHVAAGDDAAAERILTEHASHFRRTFPVNDLVEQDLASALRQLGARCELSPRLQLLAARIEGRSGGLPVAYQQLSRLAAEGLDDPLLELDLGEMAYGLGRLDESIERLQKAVDAVALGEGARIHALGVLCEALRSCDRFREVEAAIAANPALIATAGTIGVNVPDFLAAVRAHDSEDYQEAAAILERLGRSGPNLALSGMNLVRSLERTVRVALGQPGDDDLEPLGEAGETLFMRLVARLLRAERALDRGDVRMAHALADSASQRASACSFRTLVYWAEWLRAEALLLTASTAKLRERLDAVVAECRASGEIRSWLRIARARCRLALAEGRYDDATELAADLLPSARSAPGTRARLRAALALAAAAAGHRIPRISASSAQGIDAAEVKLAELEVLLWQAKFTPALRLARALATTANESGWRFIACRAQRLGAEALFHLDQLEAARVDCDAAARVAEASGYVTERIGCGFLAAALERSIGDHERASAALSGCRELAAENGRELEAAAARVALAGTAPGRADATVLRLLRRVGLDEPLVATIETRESRRFVTASQLSAWRSTGLRLVVDARQRRVYAGRRWIELRARPTLFALVEALATTPGAAVTVDDLVLRAWGIEYHPLRHHSRVTMAISRLRSLLGSSLLGAGKDGYSLCWDHPWAVIRDVDA